MDQRKGKNDRTTQKSRIVYNGSEHALLLRDDENTIVLDFVPEQMRPLIQKTSSVHVMETLSDFKTVIRQYDVQVQQSKEPYPKNILDVIHVPEKIKS